MTESNSMKTSGWAGWRTFAAVILIVGGAIDAFNGLQAIVGPNTASFNAIGQMTPTDVQPWLSLAVLALDIVVIYALTVHGRDIDEKKA